MAGTLRTSDTLNKFKLIIGRQLTKEIENRVSKGESLVEIASATGVTYVKVGFINRGELNKLTLEFMINMANRLGMSVSLNLERDGETIHSTTL